MPLISETIESLLGGVSQQPDLSRDPSQGERQVNGLSDKARGLLKRPPTEHAAIISSSPSLWPSAFAHVISRDLKERYRVFVTDGDLKVFDARTNALVPVEFPDGKGYLAIDGDADAVYRAVTVGNSTYLTNRNILVESSTIKSTLDVNHALVVVTQADFATNYTITLDAIVTTYSTPAGNSSSVRNVISTEEIASALAQKLTLKFPTGFTFTRYGNAVAIVPTNAQPFTIEVDDGLADKAMFLIRNSIQRFADLPVKAPEGYVVEVLGDPSNSFDNFWVKFSAGAWVECPRPGELVSFNASTMPHELVRGGSHLDRVLSSGGPPLPRVGIAENSDWNETVWLLSRDGTATGTYTGPSGEEVLKVNRDVPDFYFNCALADGSDMEVFIDFESVATSAFRNDETMTFQVEYWNGASWVACANTESRRTYTAGQIVFNQSLKGNVPGAYAAAGADIRLNESHTAPTPNGALAFLRAPRYRNSGHIAVQFDTTAYYPGGIALTLTLDGAVAFNYTPTSDETGIAVATAFVTLVDAHASYSALSGGEGIVEIYGATITSVADIVPTAAWSTATKCHIPSASMVTSTLVGTTIRNLSDGSEGTVTANTATTLTVSALTGGNHNLFKSGDIISVDGDSTTFVFRQVAWDARETGSLTLTPWPSFVGRTINEVFYYRGRLGFCAGDSVALSEAGEVTNFFRTTVTQVLDSDPIDARSTAPQGAVFHAAVNLDGAQFLFTERDQFVLSGEPALTPKSVRIELVTSFESQPNLRPVVAGRRVFFPLSHRGASQMMEYQAMSTRQGTFYDGDLVTKHVPKYILGAARQMALSPELGILVVLAEEDTNPTAMMYGSAYLTAGDIPDAPPPDATLLGGLFDYVFLTESDLIGDVSVATPDAYEDTDTILATDAVVESGAAHPDKAFEDSATLTESETVSDYDTATAAVTAYSVVEGLDPDTMAVTFTGNANTNSIQFELNLNSTGWYTEATVNVTPEVLYDYGELGSGGSWQYRFTPYTGAGGTGTAGDTTPVGFISL